jgi:hypothetical protein
MWGLRHFTTLWTSTACYRDSYTILANLQKFKPIIIIYQFCDILNLLLEGILICILLAGAEDLCYVGRTADFGRWISVAQWSDASQRA